jgi:hypothetical protein
MFFSRSVLMIHNILLRKKVKAFDILRKMEDFMTPIREDLRKYKNFLQNDNEEFIKKLNLTRKHLFDYLDQHIEYLINIKKEFNEDFNYLDEENKKTCENNQQQLDRLCLAVNQNYHNSIRAFKLLEEFKQKFPLRPTMLKYIPEYDCKDININDFITKQEIKENSSTVNHHSSSPLMKEQLLTNHNESSDHHNRSPPDRSFIPIDNSIPTGSIGSSHHKQFASENNESEIESQSRLVSVCSTINGADNMVDISFKIPYQRNRSNCVICFNEDENYLLIYLIFSHQLEYVSLNSHEVSLIDLPVSEPLLNLGYCPIYRLFYLSTRQTHRFVLFKLNQQKQIEIEEEIELINPNDHFISVHIYEHFIFYLYLSSSTVMFGKYDLEKSSFISPISFENKLYDVQEKSTYKIIDFAINNSFISFLTQLNKKNKFLIMIHDYDTMVKLHTFDLIDAIRPISIVSTEK